MALDGLRPKRETRLSADKQHKACKDLPQNRSASPCCARGSLLVRKRGYLLPVRDTVAGRARNGKSRWREVRTSTARTTADWRKSIREEASRGTCGDETRRTRRLAAWVLFNRGDAAFRTAGQNCPFPRAKVGFVDIVVLRRCGRAHRTPQYLSQLRTDSV
jgi:hypothetical protein